jgi:DNA-binding winged helix-turn-helix (wHTH) protein
MGLPQAAGYTRLMPEYGPPEFQCGELRVSPVLGVVSNSRGESTRLGPVNMKVLSVLLAQPGRMVSRGELFEGVWPNQIVSDDALTRCVSDIRGQLRKLSGRDDWIETLPKRGYRWIGEISEAGSAEAVAVPPETAPIHLVDTSDPGAVSASTRAGHPLLRLAGRGFVYLVALAVMASLVVWAIDRFSTPLAPVIAVLPVSAAPASAAAAAEFDRGLRAWLGKQEPVRVLARSAVDARPANPFPFFAYEFGARWLIEAGLEESGGQTIISIAVADARTGIVEMLYSERVAAGSPGEQLLSDLARKALGDFFESQLGAEGSISLVQ